MNLAERQPVAVRAAITTVVTALVHLAVVFGLVDKDQEAAIGGAVDAAGVLVLILWTKAGVTPNAKVISAVTPQGVVVAGDAALAPTGTQLRVRTPSFAPRVEAVAVNPDLVS